jgi:branched-chain amino acid transport system substrate-binding protein
MARNLKETVTLLLTLVLTGGVVAGGVLWLGERMQGDESATVQDVDGAFESRFSRGERWLITDNITPEKQAAQAAIAAGDLPTAIQQLEASLVKQPNDPEALIYLNNLRADGQLVHRIATAVPIGSSLNAAKELLRGVAQSQNQINQGGGIKGIPLQVLVVNDDNDPAVVQAVAQALVEQPEVLAVVGHFGSDSSLAGAEVYEAGQLVMISPTSTSVALSTAGDYIFRTVPSDRFAGSALARYQLDTLQTTKAAVFYNAESNYSQSLRDVFMTDLASQGGEIVAEFNFTAPDFNAEAALNTARANGAETLMLAPNSAVFEQMVAVVTANQGALPILAGDSAYKPELLATGEAGTGIIIAVPWHILGDPDATFPQVARDLWGGDVNWRTAMAYDAVQAIAQGIAIAPSRTGLQTALLNNTFTNGTQGEIKFLPSGDRNQAVQLVTIEPGTRTQYGYEFVPVTP